MTDVDSKVWGEESLRRLALVAPYFKPNEVKRLKKWIGFWSSGTHKPATVRTMDDAAWYAATAERVNASGGTLRTLQTMFDFAETAKNVSKEEAAQSERL